MNNQRTPAFLLANLGSEISRLISAHELGDTAEKQRSLERAKKIFTTLETSSISEAGLAELQILRKVVEDIHKRRPEFAVSPETLRDYFMPFARLVVG